MNSQLLKSFLRRSNERLEEARAAGLVLPPRSESHDQTIARSRSAVEGVTKRDVAGAFVASLGSRRLELRSAFASFAVLQHLPGHKFSTSGLPCPMCGEYGKSSIPEDLTEFNFERYKWGGVRHDQPSFASFDLQEFRKLERCDPTPADIDILRRLLEALRKAPPETTASKAAGLLADIVPSNKQEREILVGILGLAGILASPGHPGFYDSFVPFQSRELPERRFVDMAYPACWWRATHGLGEKSVDGWFGDF